MLAYHIALLSVPSTGRLRLTVSQNLPRLNQPAWTKVKPMSSRADMPPPDRLNERRRHETTAQRAKVAAKLATIKVGEFTGNQWGARNRAGQMSQAEAAKLMKVGRTRIPYQ